MRVDELERELRAQRPEPEPGFARRLDEWAADGFPRDRGLGPWAGGRHKGRAGGLRGWIPSAPPRRLLVGAALATVLVVGAVLIGRAGELGDDLQGGPATVESSAATAEPDAGSAGAAVPEAGGDSIGRLAEKPVIPADGLAGQGAGGIARGTENRIVDASARIVLGAEAAAVQEVANEVVGVADRHQGVVLESQVTSDQAGARADFELEIPYRQLDAALADLSGLTDVVSRTEAGEDITARAVRARKRLAATFERIREAQIELIQADTRQQRLIARSRIASLQATADALDAELRNVKRRGRFATVEVEVTSAAGTSEGDWGLRDALGDAGRVIEVIAGVALVSLAVLAPAALLAVLAWPVAARVRRRRRERALDQPGA